MEHYIQGKDHGRMILNSVETILLSGSLLNMRMTLLGSRLKKNYPTKKCFELIMISRLPTLFFKVLQQMFTLLSIITQLPKTYGTYLIYLCTAHHYQNTNVSGKFVTDVKLARDLHMSNYDQLYAYLEQHEAHANEARLMHERFPDPLTLSNPYGAPHHPKQYATAYPTNLSHTQPSVTQNSYPPLKIPQQPQAEFPQLDSGLVVPTFLPDPRGAYDQVSQTTTHNAAFQTDDLDVYDSKCDDIASTKVVFTANLSSCDSDVLSEVPYSNTFQNDMMHQSVQEL
nr:hypothetical protein [Tanacetum cinerariifolium]